MSKSVFIAVPSYLATLDAGCAYSIIGNTRQLEKSGYKALLHFEVGRCWIDDGRNLCVKKFLESDCDRLLFVDADLGFAPDAMEKILSYNEDIVAGIYPYKAEKVQPVVPLETLRYAQKGLLEADWAPTGFMSISRTVFEALEKAHPDWYAPNQKRIAFFANGQIFLGEGDSWWYGEDEGFCRRWQKTGGKIFVAPDISFVHSGRRDHTINLKDYLVEKGWYNPPEGD